MGYKCTALFGHPGYRPLVSPTKVPVIDRARESKPNDASRLIVRSAAAARAQSELSRVGRSLLLKFDFADSTPRTDACLKVEWMSWHKHATTHRGLHPARERRLRAFSFCCRYSSSRCCRACPV